MLVTVYVVDTFEILVTDSLHWKKSSTWRKKTPIYLTNRKSSWTDRITYSRRTMFDSVMHKFWVWVIGEGASVVVWFVWSFKGFDSRKLNNSCCWSVCPCVAEFALDKFTTPGHGFSKLSSVTLSEVKIGSNEVFIHNYFLDFASRKMESNFDRSLTPPTPAPSPWILVPSKLSEPSTRKTISRSVLTSTLKRF